MKHVARTAGFTLLEVMVSLAVFSVVGYALTLTLGTSQRLERSVASVAAGSQSLREATALLGEELGCARDSTLTVATLGDGNHQATFQVPILQAGAVAWGVHDRRLGSTESAQNRSGWSLRYTVLGTGADRRLVRQVLDDVLAVQRTDVVLAGLSSGSANPPGFRAVRTGDVWEITLSTAAGAAGEAGIRTVFDVRTRN